MPIDEMMYWEKRAEEVIDMSKRMKWKSKQATSLPTVHIKGQEYFFDDKRMRLEKVDNPNSVYRFYQEALNGRINNFEAAEMFASNALAYADDKDLKPEDRIECLKSNLETIHTLLKDPMVISDKYDWTDFK